MKFRKNKVVEQPKIIPEEEKGEAEKKKLPSMPRPKSIRPAPLSKEEVLDLAKGHMGRAVELFEFLATMK